MLFLHQSEKRFCIFLVFTAKIDFENKRLFQSQFNLFRG